MKIKWKIDLNKTNEEITIIQEKTDIEEVKNTDNIKLTKTEEEIPEENKKELNL